MPRFYSDEVGVPLAYLAVAVALARGLDAISDPLMGWVTDRTRSRWGRRKPWIVVGAPLTGLAFAALFSPLARLTPMEASVWFAAFFGLYYLFHTICVIPHVALGAELSLDYHERTRLFGVQTYFVVAGTLVTSYMPQLLQGPLDLDARPAYRTIGFSYAVLLPLLFLPLLSYVRERPEFAARAPNPLVPGIRRALRNRPFRQLFIMTLLFGTSDMIPSIMMPYHTIYVLLLDDWELWLSMFLLAYCGVAFGTVPVWVWVSTRIGKQRALVASGAIGAAWMVTFFYLAAPGREWFVLIMWGVLGLQFAAWTLLYPALLADVIDYDELCTGKRREAQYASIWTAVRKFVAIPAASVPLVLLGAAGYVPNQPQTPEVVLWIRILIAGFPGFLMAAGAAVILFYPITASVHRQIREGLALHERGQTAVDPLSHATLPPPVAGVAEDDAWTLDNFSTGELRRLVRAGPTRVVVDAYLCTAGGNPGTRRLCWVGVLEPSASACATRAGERSRDHRSRTGPGRDGLPRVASESRATPASVSAHSRHREGSPREAEHSERISPRSGERRARLTLRRSCCHSS